MTFEQPFVDAVQEAVTPTEADVVVARGVILASLTDATEPLPVTEFENRWLSAFGVGRPTYGSRFAATPAGDSDRRLADPDRMDPHLAEFRSRHAVRWAVAQLVAEGVLFRGEGNQYAIQPENISVDYPGGSSSVPVLVHSPYFGEPGSSPRFLPVRAPGQDENNSPSEVLLPVGELLAGLDEILGARGAALVRESRRALRAGLYLAASSLLAAASEAAWFNLARAVPSPSSALAKLTEEGRDAAHVVRLTEQSLRDLKPSPGSAPIVEVVTQAHLFREIRNYALHPVEPHDSDREIWLTETGATLLAISARRYFVKLAGFLARFQNAG